MARIIIPLNEAIHVFTANVELGAAIKRIDATEQGPRLVVSVAPLPRNFYITIRFLGYENSTAWFALDGLPTFINLNAILKLPKGITVAGTRLKIQPGVLLQSELNLKGIAVQAVAWENGAYRIDTVPV